MGVKLFRKKFYMSAVSCFEQSGDEDLKNRCHAYYHADNASRFSSDAETLQYTATNNKLLKKAERKMKRTEAKKLKSDANKEYIKAGEMFEKIECNRQAAQCFYTSEDYKKAADLFIKINMYPQAAECFMTIREYSKAAEMFEESNLILKALECHEYLRNWEGILICLNKHKLKFKEVQRDSLINKYVPIALNSIFRMLNAGQNEDNKGQALEDKYLKSVPQILEESENDSSDDENVPQDKPEMVEETKDSASEVEEVSVDHQNEVTSTDAQQEDDVKSVDLSKNEEEEENIDTTNKMMSETSFVEIKKSELNDNFEHLSNFDPDDEFLSSNQSFSVIGSLLSNEHQSISGYSDFSIISGSRADNIVNTNPIMTNRDIYIEDIAMQKIIYYVSLFSEETKSYLQKLRSKDHLSQNENISADTFELELDNIDIELVKVLLDVLESFDMFRLCMIVCNRYNLHDHLSRYLTSACYKYSNLKLLPILSVLEINNPLFRSKQSQVSLLANEAIHNVFSLISPDMIKQHKTGEIPENQGAQTEGQAIESKSKKECWRFLFYLGFWKKLIYIMDSMASLSLCYSVGDFYNFKIIYMIFYRQDLDDDQIKQLADDQTGKWIDNGLEKQSELGVLCYKLLIEEISMNKIQPVDETDVDLECNIKLNQWLALLQPVCF